MFAATTDLLRDAMHEIARYGMSEKGLLLLAVFAGMLALFFMRPK